MQVTAYTPACSCYLGMTSAAHPGTSDPITQEKNCLSANLGTPHTAKPRVFPTGALICIVTNGNTRDTGKPGVKKDQCNTRTEARVHFLYKAGNTCTTWSQPQVPGWDGRKSNTRGENFSCLFFLDTQVLHLCWIMHVIAKLW